MLTISIRDDGLGFALASVSPRRLGISRSITERMASVPGGEAVVTSAPGAGTKVELTWRR
jgi:signal transduction histidine kinase